MSEEYCPRLIEVALPIREISAESVRDKRIDQGNTSSLHVWWARRPLAASRAVVFASIVPDPDDVRCPENFRRTVERLLKTTIPVELKYYHRGREVIHDTDPYRPYSIEDTLRNRLLMFVARWSLEYLEYEQGRRLEAPRPPQVLDDRCLVKWETSDPENPQGREVLRVARELLRSASSGRHPIIFDPFAGGGAIPLEAQRLGCLSMANDYNPVAHLILRATCDYPKRYGKPGKRIVSVEEFGRKLEREVDVRNVLVHDLEYWATRALDIAREKAGRFYPPGKDGLPVLAYIWARTVPCSNPECQAEIPLIRSLDLRSGSGTIALRLETDRERKDVRFKIVRGQERGGIGTKVQRGPAKCPVCREPTSQEDLRRAAAGAKMRERMVAVVVENHGTKDYRLVEESDIEAFEAAKTLPLEVPPEIIVPEINGPHASPRAGSHRSINLELYGFTRWGQLFNSRQLLVLHCMIESLREVRDIMNREVHDTEYRAAIAVYLALWIDRLAAFGNSFCRWKPSREAILTPFSGQSIPMMWDYPEGNPFSAIPTGGSKQLQRMLDVLVREQSTDDDLLMPQITLGSATERLVDAGTCDCVVTDPPYSDSIAYADLSDFFYVWLKRTIGDLMPEVFRTPQTPKDQEITSHRHRHEGSRSSANAYYRKLLTASFEQAKRAVREPQLVSVMFAHQSTDAWTALLAALFDAGLCPDATWPIATEMPNAALGLGTASLESSVTVVCRPRAAVGAESFKIVKKEIEKAVEEAVHRFWDYGFRGADLIVASYGPAVGVFGKYERVERDDGTLVEVPELLVFARQAARDAIAGEFRGDNLSTLYYIWANLYGATEQSWDDARLVVQIGGDIESAMDVARRYDIFVITGAKCRLALLADRGDRRGLGIDPNPPLIDALHRAMLLWKNERRNELVGYLAERGLLDEARFWKLAQALFEVLPRGSEDWKLVSALLGERDTLRTEAKRTTVVVAKPQTEFDFSTTEAGGE